MQNNTTSSFFSNVELISWTSALTLADVVIILGNAFALYIFSMNKRIHRSKAHYFLINLAVTDELVGIVSLPLYIHGLVSFIKTGWNSWDAIDYIYISIDLLSGFASMFTVVLIALDRFCAVCFPFRHRIASRKVYHYLILAIWVFSGLLTGGWAVWVRINSEIYAYFMFVSILCFILVLSVSHLLILIKVKFHQNRNLNINRNNEHEKKLARVLNVVTWAFLLTWLPFHFVNFTFFFCHRYFCIPPNVIYFTKFLQYVASFVNPLVYYASNKEFRSTLRGILHRGSNSLSWTGLTKASRKYSVNTKTNERHGNEHSCCQQPDARQANTIPLS